MFLYVETTCVNLGIVPVKPGLCACMCSHGLRCSTEVLRVFLRFCVSSKNTMQVIGIVYFCNAVGDIYNSKSKQYKG